jgi:hypothetical protein
MHRLKTIAIGVIIGVLCGGGSFAGASALRGPNRDDQRRTAIEDRAIALEAATEKYPTPHDTNFPLRALLVEMTKREDLEHHPWYTYIRGANGNIVGYFVTRTTPINACDFLSGTEDIYKGTIKMTAPSLDGIFYGGGGATGGCEVYVAQDYTTGAILKFKGPMWQSVDRPLKIDAEAIKIKR